MGQDVFVSALWRDARVAIGVATTTEVCRRAQAAHGLASTACIALGRLLTATALAGLIQRRPGSLSLQVVGQGQLGQALADMTQDGHLRGYVRTPELAFPLLPGEDPLGRRNVGHAFGAGQVSLIREPTNADFTQSAAELSSGEVDEDVERFFERSEQIRTVLVCNTLLGSDAKVDLAGGIIAQMLPGGDSEALAELGQRLHGDGHARLLRETRGDARALLAQVSPKAEEVEGSTPLVWRCRCSYARVLGALKMFRSVDLAEMMEKGDPVQVRCDFCATSYQVPVAEIAKAYERLQKTMS